MNRRTFFISSYGFVGLLACNSFGQISCLSKSAKIRFGLITDLHYAKRLSVGSRYYEQTVNKLREATKIFNESGLDFVVELGDFKDIGNNKEQSLSFLEEIEAEFKKFRGPVYHVLGNHDMDNISKTDFLEHTENDGDSKGKAYYSFLWKDLKFIVLDANYNSDGSDYDSGNFDWKEAYIPQAQQDWLSVELSTEQPVIVFLHQLLDLTQKQQNVCVVNALEVIDLLEKSNRVLAVFQGHHHSGSYHFSNRIHYFTLKGMIEGAFPANNSFAIVEIDNSLNITIDQFYNSENKFLMCPRHLIGNENIR
jgi:predicted phosphodiesterase